MESGKFCFTIYGQNNCTLTATGNLLIYQDQEGNEKVTPISALTGINFLPPKKQGKPGKVAFFSHRGALSTLEVAGISPDGAANCMYTYSFEQAEEAEKLYRYVLSCMDKI